MRRQRHSSALHTDVYADFAPYGRAGRRAWEAADRTDPVLTGPHLGNLVRSDRMPAKSITQAMMDTVP